MNKKAITILVLLGVLALPMAAMAATQFTLGGYVKMEVIWDSTQINKNLLEPCLRNNSDWYQHGRLKFTAENTRMSFTVKGPQVFGANTLGYVEWDFDNHGRLSSYGGIAAGAGGASTVFGGSPHKARIGLRHAFFKLAWPETELLMGSYWSILTEEIPETANFGACTLAGQPFLREPQIRLTQMVALGGGKLTASLALAEPENGLWGLVIDRSQAAIGNTYLGESSETPKVEGRIKYDIDLWGKAAFWGKPRPFSVRVGAAWWRVRYQRNLVAQAGNTWGENNYTAVAAWIQRDQQYLNHWLVEGSVFIPLIPTHSANLAGTASLLTQWFVGAGLSGYFEDWFDTDNYLVRQNDGFFDRELQQRYGGFIQLQYYFTNQWYLSGCWGINRAMGTPLERAAVAGQFVTQAAASDPYKTNQHYYLALWYRPIQALKFGLEYTYVRTDYFQRTTVNSNITNIGENHRMMFCGFYFF